MTVKLNGKTLWVSLLAPVAVVAAIYLAGLFGTHWANAGEVPELKTLAESNYAVLAELTEREKAKDSALEQDAMRCRQGKIIDREICGAAGVEMD